MKDEGRLTSLYEKHLSVSLEIPNEDFVQDKNVAQSRAHFDKKKETHTQLFSVSASVCHKVEWCTGQQLHV